MLKNVIHLTVEVKVEDIQIRIINAYSPQELDHTENVKFWYELESEIISAIDANKEIVVQLDANAKIGRDNIEGDPNEKSHGGVTMLKSVQKAAFTDRKLFQKM